MGQGYCENCGAWGEMIETFVLDRFLNLCIQCHYDIEKKKAEIERIKRSRGNEVEDEEEDEEWEE